MIVEMSRRPLSTKFGEWTEILYHNGSSESVALMYGEVSKKARVPFRIHSDCISAHVFNSVECDCREQLALAQEYIVDAGAGLIVWLDQDGRGNGHFALMEAAKMAREQSITQSEAYVLLGFEADRRAYNEAADILRVLEVESVLLLTNSPQKISGLEGLGVEVSATEAIALDLTDRPGLERYYEDKRRRGHAL